MVMVRNAAIEDAGRILEIYDYYVSDYSLSPIRESMINCLYLNDHRLMLCKR